MSWPPAVPCSGTVSIHWEDNATDETAYEVEVDFLALENTVWMDETWASRRPT
jgi:hypothetical protein